MVDQALDLLRLGMGLVWLPRGSKRPVAKGWNAPGKVIDVPERARAAWARGGNVGVHLGASSLFSLDIDDDSAYARLEALGVTRALLESHPHPLLGRRVKYWYRLDELSPAQLDLLAGVRVARLEGSSSSAFELRVGHDCQDVGPGSLHPDGVLYRWGGEAPRRREDLPPLPAELLLVYVALGVQGSEARGSGARGSGARGSGARGSGAQLPVAGRRMLSKAPLGPSMPEPSSLRAARLSPASRADGGELIARYCAAVRVEELLSRNGYQEAAGRWLAPGSRSGNAGVMVLSGDDGRTRAWSWHAGDWRGAEDAFGLLRVLECSGDYAVAFRRARAELGMPEAPPLEAGFDAARARVAWERGVGGVLSRFAVFLRDHCPLPANVRRSLLETLARVLTLAAHSLCVLPASLAGRSAPGMARVGKLSYSLLVETLGSNPVDVRARLELLARLTSLQVVPLLEGEPACGKALLCPADPAGFEISPSWPLDERGEPLRVMSKAQRRKDQRWRLGGRSESAEGVAAEIAQETQRAATPPPPSSATPRGVAARVPAARIPVALALLAGQGDAQSLAGLLGTGRARVERSLERLRVAGVELGAAPARLLGSLRSELEDGLRERLGRRLSWQSAWAEGALRHHPARHDPDERQRLLRLRERSMQLLARLADGESVWALLA